MDLRATLNTCFTCILVLALFPVGGCGGGGSKDPPPARPAPLQGPIVKSLTGVVADGYLSGALVWSDRNGNRVLDPDEQQYSAHTDAQGRFSLNGLAEYPLVVLAEKDVTADVQTGAKVPRTFVLTTPAGRTTVVSPLTTLVQHRMEASPGLAADVAEAEVRTAFTNAGLALGGPVNLFEDFIQKAGTNADYAKVQKIAEAAAATFGLLQSRVEAAAAADPRYTDPTTFRDATVRIVGNRVMEQLTLLVSGAGANQTPEQVAQSVVQAVQVEGKLESNSVLQQIQAAEAASLIGSWSTAASVAGRVAVVTFLDAEHFVLVQDGGSGGGGQPGVESGTYTWDTATGAFTATPLVDTNGEWGLSHPNGSVRFSVNGDALTYSDGTETFAFTRVTSPSHPLVGSWGSWRSPSDPSTAVVTFLDDSHYIFGQAEGSGAGGRPGVESGTYLWDPNTGAFTAIPIVDTNGEWGLSHPQGATGITISGNTLTYSAGALSTPVPRVEPGSLGVVRPGGAAGRWGTMVWNRDKWQ